MRKFLYAKRSIMFFGEHYTKTLSLLTLLNSVIIYGL